jgi:hypothetical protein
MRSLLVISGLNYPKFSLTMLAVVILSCFVLLPVAVAQPCPEEFTWDWSNPLPQGNRLHDVGGIGGEYFAVGAVGSALHNNGVDWQLMDTGTLSTLYGVWAAATDDVFAVGFTGMMM